MPQLPTAIMQFNFEMPTLGAFMSGFGELFAHKDFIVVIFSFLFVDFFDTAGTLVAVANRAGLVNEKGELENIEKALLSDSVGTDVYKRQHHHHHHHHGHDADEVFTSWSVQTAHVYTEDELRQTLNQIAEGSVTGTVLRAKGIVPCTDGTWLHFDLVPGECEIRRGAAAVAGMLCVIGSQPVSYTHLDVYKRQAQ